MFRIGFYTKMLIANFWWEDGQHRAGTETRTSKMNLKAFTDTT